MITKEAAPQRRLIRVTFELPPTIWANRVNLVGEFNAWDTAATPLHQRRADASWRVTLELQPDRRYRFRYLIDGKEWLNDWHADDYVENPYGSYDSVLDLTGPSRRVRRVAHS
ncbi:MAG: isoamylase early set domain-containing protein [Anaerolineae bacterium]|jgi:1,4-alpha-glucan branching enzyme